MTRRTTRHVVTVIATGVAIAGAVVSGAGIAGAAHVPAGGNVRYIFCSDVPAGHEITYYDRFGKRDEIVTLTEQTGDDLWCRHVDVTFSNESVTWSAIKHEEAGYVYTAIYVNGTMVAREEGRSDYGYTWAQAY
ncbi:hypothetical protein [Nocardia higoensis]|uniref:hypothetical protein n=1 Tax=Nocardia higoensis TaxID=228599 RepID=UPI0012F6E815|nr:hypothetical protein [Nocardia higoensis]